MNPDFSLSDWMKNWGTPNGAIHQGASGSS